MKKQSRDLEEGGTEVWFEYLYLQICKHLTYIRIFRDCFSAWPGL